MRPKKVKQLSEDDLAELNQIILEERHTQSEILRWLKAKGLSLSKSAISRHCLAVKLEASGFTSVGISLEVYSKHKKQLEEIGRLLTQKMFIDKQIDEILKVIQSSANSCLERIENPVGNDDQEAK